MSGVRGPLARNAGARAVDLSALAVATVVLARGGGATAIGYYVLLRALPSLCGVLVVCGLPSALPYFLAREEELGPRLRATLLWLLGTGALLAAAVWIALVPVVGPLFFEGVPRGVLVGAGVASATQLLLATGRSWLQGRGDGRGADLLVGVEELAFLPSYAVLGLLPLAMPARILGALVLADVAVAALAWHRLRSAGALVGGAGRPSPALAREVVSFGARGQASALLTVLNLRLDLALLGAIAGPAVLGVYAVASRYAEVLRLPGLAAHFVLYPAFRRQGDVTSALRVPSLAGRMLALSAAGAALLAAGAPVLLPAVFGAELEGAVVPAAVLALGLVLDGAAGVVLAWFYAAGRPGTTSIAAGAGLVVTVALDLLLIPRHGATGAAIASGFAYGTSAVVLWCCFRSVSRRGAHSGEHADGSGHQPIARALP